MHTIEPLGEQRAGWPESNFSGSRRRGPAAPEGLSTDVAASEAGPVTPPPHLRILLAEDDRMLQILAVRILERLGHQVTVARNGRVAVELALAEPFDLVLMDMNMPELSGCEATQAIRRFEGSTRKHLPIVALTASACPEDRELCLAAGMDDYVSKPLSPEELRGIGRFARRKEAPAHE